MSVLFKALSQAGRSQNDGNTNDPGLVSVMMPPKAGIARAMQGRKPYLFWGAAGTAITIGIVLLVGTRFLSSSAPASSVPLPAETTPAPAETPASPTAQPGETPQAIAEGDLLASNAGAPATPSDLAAWPQDPTVPAPSPLPEPTLAETPVQPEQLPGPATAAAPLPESSQPGLATATPAEAGAAAGLETPGPAPATATAATPAKPAQGAESPADMAARAEQAVAAGQFEEALDIYNKLSKKDPQYTTMTNDIYDVLLHMEKVKNLPLPATGGTRELSSADTGTDGTGKVIIRMEESRQNLRQKGEAAEKALNAGQPQEALRLYDALLKEQPKNPRYLMGKAVSLQQLGKPDDAITLYEQVADIEPQNTEAVGNMLALLAQQDPKTALSRLEILQKAHPDQDTISAQLGMAYANNGQPEKGLRFLNWAATLDPQNPTYQFNLGVLNDRTGHRDDAIAAYRRALQLAGNNPSATLALPVSSIRERLSYLTANPHALP